MMQCNPAVFSEVRLHWGIKCIFIYYYVPLEPYSSKVTTVQYTTLSAYKSLSCLIYAPAPASKFNADKDESNSTKKTTFSSQHNTQKYTLLSFECTSEQLDLIIFRGWIWTLMRQFTRVIMIVQETDLIKIISSYARVWPDWIYMIHCCQANWQVYQASAGTGNKQHCLPLTKPLVVRLISPLFAKSETINFSMSALHKPSQRNSRKPDTKQQQPTSHLLYSFSLAWDYHKEMIIDHVLIPHIMFICVCICMASTGNKFVVTPLLVQ